MGAEAAGAIPDLVKSLVDSAVDVQVAARNALGRIDKAWKQSAGAREAVPALTEVLSNQDPKGGQSREAAAEWLHRRLREKWGFPDPPETTMVDRFQARYRGKRFSFGYPACPELADQATLFHLLDGKKIGVELTEGFMRDPEASVSALVLHHPQARYFAT